jgi:IS5 family transposase
LENEDYPRVVQEGRKKWVFLRMSRFLRGSPVNLRGECSVRLALPSQRLDCPPIEAVNLNCKCRDEIIPLLRALQQVYADKHALRKILDLVGNDVNRGSSHKLGRRGLNYWSIIVLAAVRLGCNLDYDKLQDLAEQHLNLRRMMGIGDWQDETFDWRRLRDNLCLLQPQTLAKINEVVVAVGHQQVPEAIKAVRGDSFVVETNIHYPTESNLIGDGLGQVVKLSAELAAKHGLPGWRQQHHLLTKVKQLVHDIRRLSRAKAKGADRLKPGYRDLLTLAEELLERARQLLRTLTFDVEVAGINWLGAKMDDQKKELLHYMQLTEKVCDTARRRVLLGETVPNEDKIFSMFEPHTELIKRGKQPDPIQYGHQVLVIEDAAGFICHYEVVANGVLDQDLVVPVMTELQRRFDDKIQRASFDRGFHTPENQKKLAEIVSHPCIVKRGKLNSSEQQQAASVEYRQARQSHPGVESAIGALQSGNGQERCRDRSKLGYERYVGLGVLGRNLHVLGKLLIAKQDADCPAAQSKRKKQAA